MIKTHKGYLQGNQPQIIAKENKKREAKQNVKEEINVCLNCHKKKCSGTDDCFKKEKNK